MKTHEPHLSETQQAFLNTVLAHAGEQAFGKKFDLVQHGTKRYLRREQATIPVDLSDEDLMLLARLGYVQIYADPPAIVFARRLPEKPAGIEKERKVSSGERVPLSHQIFRVDTIQVYAWLSVSLLAAVVSLILLWLTVQQALAQNISSTVLSAIMTAISSLLSAVFFRNYDKANDRLKYMRSKSPDPPEITRE
ncbi:MAG: hypothetical protein FJ025_02450 [Chloroflexi bacterium]|nr:hypothetical protein [Chloroflexota bacterium]